MLNSTVRMAAVLKAIARRRWMPSDERFVRSPERTSRATAPSCRCPRCWRARRKPDAKLPPAGLRCEPFENRLGCLLRGDPLRLLDFRCGSVPAGQLGQQAAIDQSSSSVPAPAATLVPSVRGELVAQDRGDVLALAQQPDHIKVVSAFEVAPEQRKLRHPPGPKPRNAEKLAECR